MRQIIGRSTHLQTLNTLLSAGHVTIVAAAGYGKTVLLEQLIQQRPNTYRLQLTIADSDPAVLQARLAPLQKRENTIILDDVQWLADDDSAESPAPQYLQSQLETPYPRWVLAGRRLPFDTTQLQVRGKVTRLAESLAFSAVEVSQLLPPEAVKQWGGLLDGWPMGVALVAQLGKRRLQEVSQHLFTYLASEVFEQFSAEQQRFLTHTAVPLHFALPLAAVILDQSLATTTHQLTTILRDQPFLTDTGESYRYHDLFRRFLIEQLDDPATISARVVATLQARGQWAKAVEHALDGNLTARAIELLVEPEWHYLHDGGRYRTYLRWIETLNSADCDPFPRLYFNAGHCAMRVPNSYAVAVRYHERAVAVALEQDDAATAFESQVDLAFLDYNQRGSTPDLLSTLQSLTAQTHPNGRSASRALSLLGVVAASLAQFSTARDAWRRAIKLTDGVEEGAFLRAQYQRNIALYYALPLGDFAEAETIFQTLQSYFADSPGNHVQILNQHSELLFERGDWQTLRAVIDQIAHYRATLDAIPAFILQWNHYNRAALAIGTGDFAAASAERLAMAADDPESRVGAAYLHRWQLRRMGDWAGVLQLEAVIEPDASLLLRAAMALERDIALGLLVTRDHTLDFALSAETLPIIHQRSRAHLVRLRALLAVVCWHKGNPRWRRYVRRTRRTLDHPFYDHLLTARDPELGVQFWKVCLIEGVAPSQTTAALCEIGQIEPLLPLLQHEVTVVRERVAMVLAEIGDDCAMPALSAAIKRSMRNEVLSTALARLESADPPPLTIRLLGQFMLKRGDTPIPNTAFHRPVVQRLLQYLALHRGVTLPRERILADLWPDTPPDKAWKTFRSVYSRLRKVLEPAMRPQAPNRYVALEGDAYRFDPANVVTVDSLQFERVIKAALQSADSQQIDPNAVHQLDQFAPLLPNLPYADWLLEPRQRLNDLYVEGCLQLAEIYLNRGNSADALHWATRVIIVAPWLESAYQIQMRSHARQGNRTLAIKTYHQACHALQAELAIAPSSLTEWLFEKLQKAEAI